MNFKAPPWLAFLIGATIFVATRWLSSALISDSLAEIYPWLTHVILKTILIVVAVVGGLVVTGGHLWRHGYRWPTDMKWWSCIWPGLLLGTCGTTLILITPAGGMDMAKLGSGVAIALSVLYSSFSEEIFTRGFIQSLMGHLTDSKVNLVVARVSIPAITSGLLFGSLHLSVYFGGSDILTTVIIVFYTTLLGIVAGHLFEKYNSLVPAILVHVAANAGGVGAGILVVLIRFLITGELPQQP